MIGIHLISETQVKMGTPVKTVGGQVKLGPEGNIMDEDIYVIEDND